MFWFRVLLGQIVAHYTTIENSYDVKELLPRGLYFIKAETLSGNFSKSFIVE